MNESDCEKLKDRSWSSISITKLGWDEEYMKNYFEDLWDVLDDATKLDYLEDGDITRDDWIQSQIDNSYYVNAVVENVVDDLMDKLGYSETQAYNAIYRGGLKIYTCMDSGIQSICDNVINDDKFAELLYTLFSFFIIKNCLLLFLMI